jgi:hypothetical protein
VEIILKYLCGILSILQNNVIDLNNVITI